MYLLSRYGAERIQQLTAANRVTPRSRFADWKPVTMQEMEGFFGVVINMGTESSANSTFMGNITHSTETEGC